MHQTKLTSFQVANIIVEDVYYNYLPIQLPEIYIKVCIFLVLKAAWKERFLNFLLILKQELLP